jgi:hypothetical protein
MSHMFSVGRRASQAGIVQLGQVASQLTSTLGLKSPLIPSGPLIVRLKDL